MSSIEISSSAVEPSIADYPYAGWVPTANGRLSFRHVGESSHPSEAIYANIVTQTERLILAFQRRPLSDIFFQNVIHYICDISGSFWFVLVGKSDGPADNSEAIHGTVFIYKSKEDWKKYGRSKTRSAIYNLHELRLSSRVDRDQKITTTFSAATKNLMATADISVQFYMLRGGEIYFSTPTFLDSDLQYASEDYARTCGHNFAKWIADQSYFFIRDLSHKHQHHVPTSDTLLILQERSPGSSHWRINIIYGLYYLSIRIRRYADAYALFQSAGIIAYCKSFKAICEQRLKSHTIPSFGIPAFNDEAVLDSIRARSREELQRTQEAISNNANRSSFRSTLLTMAVLTLAVLAILLGPYNGGTHSSFNGLRHFAVSYATQIIFFIILFILCALTGTGNWLKRFQTGRDVLESTNARRNRSILFFSILGIFIFVVTLHFSSAAIRELIEAFKHLIVFVRSLTG